MTDETRKAARVSIENVVRAVGGGAKVDHRVICEGLMEVIYVDSPLTEDERPELTTAQQLALSVLLGEGVPLGVLVSALEESGVYPAGAVEEVRQKAVEQERKRVAHMIEAIAGHDHRDDDSTPQVYDVFNALMRVASRVKSGENFEYEWGS